MNENESHGYKFLTEIIEQKNPYYKFVSNLKTIDSAELQLIVYKCQKFMCFQSRLGQTKVVSNNQGKKCTAMCCILIRNFPIQTWNCMRQKVETGCFN
jgi:hypothetical protein